MKDAIVVPIPFPPFVAFLSKDSIRRMRKDLVEILLDSIVLLDSARERLDVIRKQYEDIVKIAEIFHRLGSAVFGLLKIPENIMSVVDSAIDVLLGIEEAAEKK